MSNALDDEIEAYEKSANNYIESLRESIKDTELLIEKTFTDVMYNADVVLREINHLSYTYGFSIDENLTKPWETASRGSRRFAYDVNMHMEATKKKVETETSPITKNVTKPWKEGDKWVTTFGGNAEDTIDDAVWKAQSMQDQMKSALSTPWSDAKTTITEWGQHVNDELWVALERAKQVGQDIEKALDVKVPDYSATYVQSSSNDNTSNNKPSHSGSTGGSYDQRVYDLQEILIGMYGASIKHDGIWGPNTKAAVMGMQDSIDYNNMAIPDHNGLYNSKTRQALINDLSNMHSDKAKRLKSKVPAAIHAKGTLGTARDEWAIDSEPWLGDELVLVPTSSGTLSYMRKGTGVLTADLTRELMDIASIGVDGLTMPKFDSGINIISSAVNKPEIKLDIQNFLRCDNVSQDSMPELKKFVNDQMNNLVKQLNYGLKKYK